MIPLVKLELRPFYEKKNANFEKHGCRGNVNVDIHVTVTSKCSQII